MIVNMKVQIRRVDNALSPLEVMDAVQTAVSRDYQYRAQAKDETIALESLSVLGFEVVGPAWDDDEKDVVFKAIKEFLK